VRVLALGNPTVSSGPFHDAFTSQREGWNLITISAFETPNLAGITVEQLLQLSEEELNQNPRPYLTTRRWVKEKYSEWGPGHPLWESRVLGNFPAQSEDALLSLAWLEKAQFSHVDGTGKIRAGLDVAGPGEDETVLTVRRGPRILFQKFWPNEDPRGEVVATLMPYKPDLEVLNVDSIGIGWGMHTHLRDIFGDAVKAVNVGESPRDPEKYSNLKAELYWGLRMRAQAGDLAGLLDERTIGQLAGIRYKHNARGQVVIESKEDARKRGVKSPDRAESVMLAFAETQWQYGYDEYLRQEIEKQEKQELNKIEIPKQLLKPTTGDKQLTCPSCGATIIVRVGGMWRCNQCGEQFGNEPNIYRGPSRRDVLS